MTTCLVCSSETVRRIIPRLNIWQCLDCGLQFVWPMPSEAELDCFYSRYEDPRAAAAVVKANAEAHIGYLEHFGFERAARVLDFGCGSNAFAGALPNAQGYDPYTLPNNPPPSGAYDWITSFGVLEHVPYPRGTTMLWATLLRPGGMVALTTVSTETGIAFRYKPPEHVTYWTEASLRKLLEPRFTIVSYAQHWILQTPEIYMSAVLKAGRVPDGLQQKISFQTEGLVKVPTNEVIVIARKE